MPHVKSLKDRIKDKEFILVAEGYLFEFERRGYLKAGAFVPEVVVEHPELVEQLHREFVHAGSDVVQAFTYYGHREKLRVIGREDELEKLNRTALRLAKKVAVETGTLMAGNICNTTAYDPNDPKTHEVVRSMFKEQIEWAVQEGADFIVGETYTDLGEAKLAVECIKKYGQGLPSVVTFAQLAHLKTRDGFTYAEACRQLEEAGADVVGLNCSSGPEVYIHMMKEVRKACKGPIAALPVPYRCNKDYPNMQTLVIPETGKRAFPDNLDYFLCSSDEIAHFGEAMKEIGVQYVGICCGNSSRYFRRLAETLGRRPAASRYSPDMSQHYIFGSNDNKLLHKCNLDTLRNLYYVQKSLSF
jgi:betaine-homocysteine S-methyltransferase